MENQNQEMPKGNYPDIHGYVTVRTQNKFEKIGKIALWKNEVEPNSRLPPLTGIVIINGQRYRVGMWESLEEINADPKQEIPKNQSILQKVVSTIDYLTKEQ